MGNNKVVASQAQPHSTTLALPPFESLRTRQIITAMWEEYGRDEECDYSKINALIEAAYESITQTDQGETA